MQLHRPNRPPSFALVLREDLSRLVVLAPSVHPSSRLPLIVQHLLVVPGVPPTLLSSISCSYTRPVYGVQCLLGFLLLVPRSPSGSWLHLFYSFGPSYSLIPVSCLLVLLSPGCSAVGATSAPWEPLMAPCSSSPGPVCARMHVCTCALTPPPVSWACVCMHTTIR